MADVRGIAAHANGRKKIEMRSQGKRTAWLRVMALVATLLLVTTACGGDEGGTVDTTAPGATDEPGAGDAGDTEETSAEELAEPTGGGETTELNVGVLPLAVTATVIVAQDSGYFEEEGLTVNVETVPGGAALVPGLMAGEIQLGFGNYFSQMQAVEEDFPLVIAGGNHVATPGAGFTGLYTLPDSGYTQTADLAGATIGINTLNSISELIITTGLAQEGIDRDQYEYVEVPFPEGPAALQQGNVDVVWTAEPFRTEAINEAGAVPVLVDPENTDDPRLFTSDDFVEFPQSGYVTTEEFNAQNREVIEGFMRAIDRAVADINSDITVAVDAADKFTETPRELLEEINWPTLDAVITEEQLQRMADMMQESGFSESPLDVSEFTDLYSD